MESLGAAASVAGLISLALEIPKIIDTVVSIKSAPEEAKQFLQTVTALVATLQRLEAFLKSDEAEDLELKDDSILTVSISICKDRVLSLLKKLRSHLPKTSGTRVPGLKAVKETATRFRWPFDKTECLNLVTEINAMQNAFEFCLAMQNYRQMAKSHREIIGYFKEQGNSLDKIKAFFPDLAAHISTMLEKIEAFESYLPDADQKLSNIQAAVEELQMANKDFIEQDADNLYGQALEWFSPIDPSEKHQKIADARLPETCEWILTNAHFEQWVKTPPSDSYAGVTCWVGDPGQGKTFTMSRIIDYLDELRLSDDTIYMSYLYCDYQSPEDYSETSLAGAIVRQLLTQFSQLPKEVTEMVHHTHIKHRRPNARMDEVIKVLTHLSPTVKRLLVCVDALDECKRADDLVAACAKFPLPTSFIFLGRGSIVQTVKQFFPSTIARPMELQQKDVDAIVIDKIQSEKSRQPELMPGSLEKAIRSEVGKLANGMLLLASLHTTLVLSHDTIHNRQEALKDLSSTLEDAFGQSIARLQKSSRSSRALQILAWIHLIRPLSLDELIHALAIERHHTRFYKDNRPSPAAILDCCLGLVKLDNPKGLRDIFQHSPTVTLVHSSLRVYLDSNPEILQAVVPRLAETCLTYHSFPRLDETRVLDPLMSSSWLLLLRKSQPLSPQLEGRVWNYCRALNACINKSKTWQGLNETSMTLPSHAKAIAFRIATDPVKPAGFVRQAMINTICMLGLDTIDEILSRVAKHGEQLNINSVDSHDSFGVTPLGWVLFPIRRSCNDFGARPFLPAFESLDESLQHAQRLIKQFPVFDPSEPMWHTHALAAIHGTMNFTTRRYHLRCPYRSPFLFLLGNSFHASQAKDVISQIEKSTDVGLWSSFRSGTRTPESHAWNLLILRPCVHFCTGIEAYWESDDEDGDGNHNDDDERRVSTRQVFNGRISALFGPQSPVPFCIMTGPSQDRCRRYCDTRADVRKETTHRLPDALHRTYLIPREALLHVGAASDSPQVVNYAISNCSVDENGRDDKGQTALQVALRFMSLSTADILIQRSSSDLSTRDSTGVTLLHVCARNEYTQFALTILGKHPELINLVDQAGKTALHYAISRIPRLRMVQLLLANGADVNIENHAGNTPLHQAILTGSSSLELLSQANISASNFQRAWDLAFKSGAKSVMSLLRSLGSGSSMLFTTGYDQSGPVLSYNNRTVQLLLATQGAKDFTAADLAFMMELGHDLNVSGEASSYRMDVTNAATTIQNALIKGARTTAVFLLRQFPTPLRHVGQDRQSVLRVTVAKDALHVLQTALGDDKIDETLMESRGHAVLDTELMQKFLHMTEILLDCPGVPVDQTTNTGGTLLHLAIEHRFSEAITLLLANSQVPANQLDGSGRTPLHLAVFQQDSTLVKLLLECPRVIPETPSRDGRTALAYAYDYEVKEIVSLLLDTGKFDVLQEDS